MSLERTAASSCRGRGRVELQSGIGDRSPIAAGRVGRAQPRSRTPMTRVWMAPLARLGDRLPELRHDEPALYSNQGGPSTASSLRRLNTMPASHRSWRSAVPVVHDAAAGINAVAVATPKISARAMSVSRNVRLGPAGLLAPSRRSRQEVRNASLRCPRTWIVIEATQMMKLALCAVRSRPALPGLAVSTASPVPSRVRLDAITSGPRMRSTGCGGPLAS